MGEGSGEGNRRGNLLELETKWLARSHSLKETVSRGKWWGRGCWKCRCVFIFLCVYCVCLLGIMCPRRPEEVWDPPVIGVAGWLWTEPGSLREQYKVLNPLSLEVLIFFLIAVVEWLSFVEGERKLLTIFRSFLLIRCLTDMYLSTYPSPPLYFWGQGLAGRTGWPRAHCIYQAALELPLCLRELGVQPCAATSGAGKVFVERFSLTVCGLSCAKHCSECFLCNFGLIITKWDLVAYS